MALVYPDLGKAVTEAWNEVIKKVPPSLFIELVTNAMGVANSSIEEYIRYYQGGMYYGTISNKPRNPNDRFERLSVFLFALGFPGKDGKYQRVLDGLESMAASGGYTFAFPPPEDKRISYEGIKAKYEEQEGSRSNSNEEKVGLGIPKNTENNEKGLHGSITSLLAASNGNNHTIGRHQNILTDEGYIRDVTDTSEHPVSKLTLGISDLDGGNYRVYAISYTTFNGGERYTIFKALQQFLEAERGKKARIMHHHEKSNLPTVKIIEVDGSTVIYHRGGKGGVLKPYDLKAENTPKTRPAL